MKHLDLNGSWQFKASKTTASLPPRHRRVRRWMAAEVPGTVHTDLMRQRVIPDPFYRTNENDVQWVADQQWLYRRTFDVPRQLLAEEAVHLVAEGLDTYATIRINGKHVATTANMFIEHRFEIKRFLRVGKNSIEIEFDSPITRSRALEKKHGRLDVALEPHRVYVRKAQYSFGWDWGPKLPTSGIWQSISLEAFSYGKLKNPFVHIISLNRTRASIEITVEIERETHDNMYVHAFIGGPDIAQECDLPVRGNKAILPLQLRNPHLWWPNGSGDQPMYTAVLSLMRNGQEVHTIEVPFALRTVRLLQEPDREGTSFIIEINGKKIYCKGADWIPCSSFLPNVEDSTYERLLHLAKDAHINMLRVWGGGVYERETFYRLCDELGLMVWQDFMFACGEYPQVPWFLRQIEAEAEEVVRRLRNHPSIVLWCGNNECEWLFCTENPDKSPEEMSGAIIFRELLPAVCDRLDRTRPYWRSSPFGEGFPNAESNGNHHQWMVWSSWKDFSEYEKDHARFVTEFGFQSPAHIRTFKTVTLPTERHPQSITVQHHNKQVEGTERLYRFLAAHYIVPTDFEEFIYRTQLLQAEALKYAVEHWRRRKFATAGALFWQLNDCWPVSSWSVIDSALHPKAAYYFAQRFFAPVLLSFKRHGKHLKVWITSDLLQPVKGTLDLAFTSVLGQTVWTRTLRVALGSNASSCLLTLDLDRFASYDAKQYYILGRLQTIDCYISVQRFFFREPKHLLLPKPDVKATLRRVDHDRCALTLQARTFVKNLRIEIEGTDTVFEDNYFDMDAGTTACVRFTSEQPLAELSKRLSLHSLYDRGIAP